MFLEPGDDQQALVVAVRAVLDDLVTPAARQARRDGAPIDRATWSTLGELGVFGLAVPEAHGGLGLGIVEVCLVLEELGRSGLSAPVLEAGVVVAPMLAGLADDRRGLLDDLLAGRTVATAALTAGSRLAADAVEAAVIASLGPSFHLDVAGAFACRPQRSLDSSRRVAVVEPDGARSVDVTVVERTVLADQVVLTNAALLLGISATLLDRSVAYSAERHQFGRPIGSFQAIKHLLADVHVELEASRAAIWAAALDLDAGHGEAREAALASVAVAAAVTGEAAERANVVALQVHGGIGYTWEDELQTWLKQGLVVGRRLGRPAVHRRRAAVLAGLLPERRGLERNVVVS